MPEDHIAVGKPLQRIDGIDKVTGSAKYAADIKFENLLHARLLRSPHAHARVTHIDTSAAEKLPGVRAVATILEVPKVIEYWFSLRTEEKKKQMFLRDNVVRFIGDPVLALAADDQATAERACSLIKVEYQPLPALQDPFEAMAARDVKIHARGNVAFKFEKVYGDTRQGFKNADIIIENTFRTSKQKHAALEPFGTCVAHYQSNGKLTVYSSTQLPHWSRHYLAGALELPLNKVRVIKPYTGGAFGGRCGLIHGLEVMCSWLSRRTGRAVRMSFSREEDFIATETRHPMTIKMKTGVTQDGILTANDVEIVSDVGGYGTHYIGVLADCLSTGVGLYKFPNYSFSATAVFTNKSLCGALRGYGNPQMNFAQESQLDIIADRLGMDPLELRLKNYRGLGEIDPVLDQEIRSNGLKECLEKGAESSGWVKKRLQEPGKGPKKRGIGLSVMLHGTGAGKALPDPAAATIMINADGSVNLVTAAADEGQGNRTVLAQIASETLGIEFEKISVSETDTETTPLDCGTHGSRQAYGGGLAVQAAANEARQKILAYAAKELGVIGDHLRIKDGAIHDTTHPDNKILISDLMRKTQIEDMGVCDQVIGSAAGVAPAMPGYYGAVFAEVEVDTETGEVNVLKLTSAFDVGRAINPDLVKGQIIGGGVMGMGFALTEGLLVEGGRILNSSFTDYRLLRACDVPKIVPIIVESNEPTGPYGAKGIGEGCMVNVAAAISNAICHATGVRLTDLCMTSEAILKSLESL
ncbi:MAG: molybdopterin cofactor-binding domain-containing protein [Desulfobacteraceae bacterium]|jgi:xanthine dehydrogenase molybdenum-binding subunit|nr:molybdopterin cofactor-binding domain-containing protein [Desulfobacteraceae bacterium]